MVMLRRSADVVIKHPKVDEDDTNGNHRKGVRTKDLQKTLTTFDKN